MAARGKVFKNAFRNLSNVFCLTLSVVLYLWCSSAKTRWQTKKKKNKNREVGKEECWIVCFLSETMISDIVFFFVLCLWFGLFKSNGVLHSEVTRSQQTAEPVQWHLSTINQMLQYVLFCCANRLKIAACFLRVVISFYSTKHTHAEWWDYLI